MQEQGGGRRTRCRGFPFVGLALATHPQTDEAPEGVKRFVRWGASPRAAQGSDSSGPACEPSAKGGPMFIRDDIRYFADEVLKHRTLLNYDGQAENVQIGELIQQCVANVTEKAA